MATTEMKMDVCEQAISTCSALNTRAAMMYGALIECGMEREARVFGRVQVMMDKAYPQLRKSFEKLGDKAENVANRVTGCRILASRTGCLRVRAAAYLSRLASVCRPMRVLPELGERVAST